MINDGIKARVGHNVGQILSGICLGKMIEKYQQNPISDWQSLIQTTYFRTFCLKYVKLDLGFLQKRTFYS